MCTFTILNGLSLFLWLISCYPYLGVRYCADASDSNIEVSMPSTHVALSNDLYVAMKSISNQPQLPPLEVQLTRVEGSSVETITTILVNSATNKSSQNISTSSIVKVPCGYLSKGGQYYVILRKQSADVSSATGDFIASRGLVVRWPRPHLSMTPERIQTYPQGPVTAILEFRDVKCSPIESSSQLDHLPELWLELFYCGHSLLFCDNNLNQNETANQVLYSEQIRGLPGRYILMLRCELFGLAGHYALFLRPATIQSTLLHTKAYIKSEWSEEFVFNVHARSIFPCDVHNGGVPVLFQYPSCILASGDRVRLFAKLRANVASLVPPTTLEYVAEQKVAKGQHTLHFDCDLFTERYIDYCFVYVSQAISGAVADVRMDCVPTLPVSENESGGWGSWSQWTTCSSTCIGGTRSRYRFCDSPPPRYGAKFCQGKAVETEKCGKSFGWECLHSNSVTAIDVAAENPEIELEVGHYCRCGCVVHLGQAKPKRLLATSSKSCPGRTFWLIQADENYGIQFKVEQFNLICGTQWLKVRDGSSLSSTLLAYLFSGSDSTPSTVQSSGSVLLLEFYSDKVAIGGQICGGGFLGFATQSRNYSNSTLISTNANISIIPAFFLKMKSVHIAAFIFLSCLLLATGLLALQYIWRYRKYQIARAEDDDPLTDSLASCANVPIRMKTLSNPTLLSEVISLTMCSPIKKINNQIRLKKVVHNNTDRGHQEITLAKEESLGSNSTITSIHPDTSASPLQQTGSDLAESCSSLTSSVQNYEKIQNSSLTTIDNDYKNKNQDKLKHQKRNNLPKLSYISSPIMTHVRPTSKIDSESDPDCYSMSTMSNLGCRGSVCPSINMNEVKHKCYQQNLQSGTHSDFSLGVDTDLEMDYYDYNVVNAGAAPGSYLGMDPAFLVWIPPLDSDADTVSMHESQVDKYAIQVEPSVNTTVKNRKVHKSKGVMPTIIRKTLSKSSKLRPKCKSPIKVHNRKHEIGEKDDKNLQLRDEYANNLDDKLCNNEDDKSIRIEKKSDMILDDIKFADEDDDLSESDNKYNLSMINHEIGSLSS